MLELEGQAVHHAGDTDRAPELDEVKADVAFLPIGGHFTMDADQAAGPARTMAPGSPSPCTAASSWARRRTANGFRDAASPIPVELMEPTNPFERT